MTSNTCAIGSKRAAETKPTGATAHVPVLESSGMRTPGMGGGAPGMGGGGGRPPMPQGMPQGQHALMKKTFKTSFRLVNQ